VATLHGELSKVQRSNILNDFRRDRLRALMVSDLVARGLDVSDCDAGAPLDWKYVWLCECACVRMCCQRCKTLCFVVPNLVARNLDV
jgi:hypothetical protein